jgi:hypothetical protein
MEKANLEEIKVSLSSISRIACVGRWNSSFSPMFPDRRLTKTDLAAHGGGGGG